MMSSALVAGEKVCTKCKLRKLAQDFHYRVDDEDNIIGYATQCKDCEHAIFIAKRDGTKLEIATEGGLAKTDARIRLFSEAVREEAIAQIERDRSLQTCADHLGIGVTVLHYWLNSEKEPYASWAKRFRLARVRRHKKPLEEAMRQEAVAGNIRALEFLLRTGWKEEYGEDKSINMKVSRDQDDIDFSRYSKEELKTLEELLNKGKDTP